MQLLQEVEASRIHPLDYMESEVRIRAFAFEPHLTDSPLEVLMFDKYWDVLLFLLSGEYRRERPRHPWTHPFTAPLAWAVVGRDTSSFRDDDSVEPEWPIRYALPDDVAAIDAHLRPLTFQAFVRPALEAGPDVLNGLYHGHLAPTTPNDERYAHLLHALQAFYAARVRLGEGVLYKAA